MLDRIAMYSTGKQLMKRATTISLISLVLFGSSCAVVEQIINPVKPKRENVKAVRHMKDGFRFNFPEGWTVASNEITEDGYRFVTVEDTYSSIFTLSLAPEEFEYDLQEAADSSFEDLKSAIPVGTITAIEFSDSSRVVNGATAKGIKQEFLLTLAGEKLRHTAECYVINVGDRNGFIRVQAADEDWPAAEKEFEIVLEKIEFKEPVR